MKLRAVYLLWEPGTEFQADPATFTGAMLTALMADARQIARRAFRIEGRQKRVPLLAGMGNNPVAWSSALEPVPEKVWRAPEGPQFAILRASQQRQRTECAGAITSCHSEDVLVCVVERKRAVEHIDVGDRHAFANVDKRSKGDAVRHTMTVYRQTVPEFDREQLHFRPDVEAEIGFVVQRRGRHHVEVELNNAVVVAVGVDVRGMADEQAVADVEGLARPVLEVEHPGEIAHRHHKVLQEVQPADDIDIEQVRVRKEGSGRDPRLIVLPCERRRALCPPFLFALLVKSFPLRRIAALPLSPLPPPHRLGPASIKTQKGNFSIPGTEGPVNRIPPPTPHSPCTIITVGRVSAILLVSFMARISIREYEHISAVTRGIVPVGEEPAVASQTFTITGATQSSSAFNIRTRFVRIHTDVNCSLEFGTAPTATAGSCDMVAGQTEYFGVVNATSLKVAFITS